MISKGSNLALPVLLVALGTAPALWLRFDNARLRREVSELHRQGGQAVRLREENVQLREQVGGVKREAELATASSAGKGGAAQGESQRDDQQAGADARAAALAANRDPEKDFVLVENFRNAGRGTPSAAFQTLVWAAVTGDERTLADLLTFDPQVRGQLEAWIAALPAPAREKYPTPESLAALFFSELVTGHTAARVLAQDAADPQPASVTIAFEHMAAGRPLSVLLAPEGWQLAVTAEMAGEFLRQMRGRAGPMEKK